MATSGTFVLLFGRKACQRGNRVAAALLGRKGLSRQGIVYRRLGVPLPLAGRGDRRETMRNAEGRVYVWWDLAWVNGQFWARAGIEYPVQVFVSRVIRALQEQTSSEPAPGGV